MSSPEHQALAHGIAHFSVADVRDDDRDDREGLERSPALEKERRRGGNRCVETGDHRQRGKSGSDNGSEHAQ